MRRKRFGLLSGAILSFGLLLAAPGAWAQMRSGPPGPPGNMNQPDNGMQSNNGAQATFVANMRRNLSVETDLSKMALKNSSNDDVKKLAHQVISENRSNEMGLSNIGSNFGPSNGPVFAAPVPSETRQAEKKMKKLTGTQFDLMYLGELNGYVKSDQQLIASAPDRSSSGEMGATTMRLRDTADQRAKQIAQVAQSENFKLP